MNTARAGITKAVGPVLAAVLCVNTTTAATCKIAKTTSLDDKVPQSVAATVVIYPLTAVLAKRPNPSTVNDRIKSCDPRRIASRHAMGRPIAAMVVVVGAYGSPSPSRPCQLDGDTVGPYISPMQRKHNKVPSRHIFAVVGPPAPPFNRLTASDQLTAAHDEAMVKLVWTSGLRAERHVENDDTLGAAYACIRLANPIAICCALNTIALTEVVTRRAKLEIDAGAVRSLQRKLVRRHGFEIH